VQVRLSAALFLVNSSLPQHLRLIVDGLLESESFVFDAFMQLLVEAGGEPATSAAEAVAKADFVVTMVPNDKVAGLWADVQAALQLLNLPMHFW
jgi:hypothetical protein